MVVPAHPPAVGWWVSRIPVFLAYSRIPFQGGPNSQGCPQRLASVPDPSGRRPSVIFLSRSGLILEV